MVVQHLPLKDMAIFPFFTRILLSAPGGEKLKNKNKTFHTHEIYFKLEESLWQHKAALKRSINPCEKLPDFTPNTTDIKTFKLSTLLLNTLQSLTHDASLFHVLKY